MAEHAPPSRNRRLAQVTRKSIAALSALAVGVGASLVMATANAAPQPNPNSAYDDNIGRNIIGDEPLGKLDPKVSSKTVEAKQGETVNYEFEVNAGFPADTNNVTAQRWMRLRLTQDEKVPFQLDDRGNPIVKAEGINGLTFTKIGTGTWEAKLGFEYGKIGDARVNNRAHFQWTNSGDSAWDKGQAFATPSNFTISVPATVKQDADGSFASGKLEVLSGRLADVELEQGEIPFTFDHNDGNGQCTWNVEYDTKLAKTDAGYWIAGVEVIPMIDKNSADFRALSPAYQRIKPGFVEGAAYHNDTKLGDLRRNASAWSAEEASTGTLDLKTEEDPDFATNVWMNPTKPITVKYKVTSPCGEKVNDYIVKNKPKVTSIDSRYPDGTLRNDPSVAFVQGSKVEVNIVRPPEDAVTTGTVAFKKKTDVPPPMPKFSVSKVLSDPKSDPVQLEDHSFTVHHTITVKNESDVVAVPPIVYDTIAPVPGFKVDKVIVGDTGGVKPTPEMGKPFSLQMFSKVSKESPVTFDVAVTYTRIDQQQKASDAFTANEASEIGTCDDFLTSQKKPREATSGHGIINSVVLSEGNKDDADAQLFENNWDCVSPSTPEPKFGVSKTAAAGSESSVEVREDGKFTTRHTVTVEKFGEGTHGLSPEVFDKPRPVPGFEVEGLLLNDRTELQPDEDGWYLLSHPIEFGAGKTEESFTVTVTYKRSADNKATGGLSTAEYDQIGQCEKRDSASTSYASDKATGIINDVALGKNNDGDSDDLRAGNNWDCFSPVKPEPKGSVYVGDFVWHDIDRDGLQGKAEKGIEGVELALTLEGKPVYHVSDGTEVKNETTGEKGDYAFIDLPILKPGQHYTVTVVKPPQGMIPTKNIDGDREHDSSTESADSKELLKDNEGDDTLDFGFFKSTVSVGDFVWFDENKNGIQDDGEKGLAGVTLTLYGPDGVAMKDANGNFISTTTDESGRYAFTGLPVLMGKDVYTVKVIEYPDNVVPTYPGKAARHNDSSTGSASTIVGGLAEDGAADNTLDFGFMKEEVIEGSEIIVDYPSGDGSTSGSLPGETSEDTKKPEVIVEVPGPIDFTEDTQPGTSGNNGGTTVTEDTKPEVIVEVPGPIDFTEDTQPGTGGNNDGTTITEDTKPTASDKGGVLAWTGANIAGLSAVTAMLLAAGALLLRRKDA